MAIYHLHAKVLSRSEGRSATAAAAYRAAHRIVDERTGLVFDYSRRRDVAWTCILAPRATPAWAKSRQDLWNEAEKCEKRKDAQVAREVEVALPRELSREDQILLIKRFVHSQFVKAGMVADVAIHDKAGNPHAHILLTTRAISESGFGSKNRSWNDHESLARWRSHWTTCCNTRLMVAGRKERITHQSLIDQGKNRSPTIHIGAAACAMAKRGKISERNTHNNHIKEKNMSNTYMETRPLADTLTLNPKEFRADAEPKAANLFVGPSATLGDQTRNRASIFVPHYGAALIEIFSTHVERIDRVQTPRGDAYRLSIGSEAVYDHGTVLRCSSGTGAEVRIALLLAVEKGWTAIQATGSPAFRRALFFEAVSSGHFPVEKVAGYMPTSADLASLHAAKRPLAGGNIDYISSRLFGAGDSDDGQQNAHLPAFPRLKF